MNNTASRDIDRSHKSQKSHPDTSVTNTSTNAISPVKKEEVSSIRRSQTSGNSSTATERTANTTPKNITKDSQQSSPVPHSPTDQDQYRGGIHEFVNLQRTFPSTPQYDNDHTYLDSAPLSPFFRASPKVTPSRYPTPRSSSLPPPKYSSSMNMSTTDLEPASGPNPSPSPSGGGDVENVLRTSASTDYEGQTQNSEGSPNASAEGTHISPSRQSQRSVKPVVSPPEDEQRRAPGSSMQMHQGGYDGPSGEYNFIACDYSFFVCDYSCFRTSWGIRV
jgi:hypothetical protein